MEDNINVPVKLEVCSESNESLKQSAEVNSESNESLHQSAEVDSESTELLNQSAEVNIESNESLNKNAEVNSESNKSLNQNAEVCNQSNELLNQSAEVRMVFVRHIGKRVDCDPLFPGCGLVSPHIVLYSVSTRLLQVKEMKIKTPCKAFSTETMLEKAEVIKNESIICKTQDIPVIENNLRYTVKYTRSVFVECSVRNFGLVAILTEVNTKNSMLATHTSETGITNVTIIEIGWLIKHLNSPYPTDPSFAMTVLVTIFKHTIIAGMPYEYTMYNLMFKFSFELMVVLFVNTLYICPYVSIPGSDYLLDGSLPLSPPQTTSTLTGVSTTVSGNATYPTLSQGSAMHFGGVPTSTSVTHTLSRSVNSAGTISSVPGTAMGLNLPGSRPPLSYCGYMLPNTGTQPLPSWSQPPWPQSYPYGGFMPNQPGFWPYRDNFYGPPSGVATAPPLAPALPVAVSLTSAVAPSTTVPDSQASSSSHGTQVSDHASPLDGLQKLLLDFGESFKAEFSTLSSRMTLLENRVSSHQPSPAKSVECDEREDDELSVSPGSHERAFLTDEDVESSSSPKVSKTAPEPSSKSAQQPPTKETEDPPSLKDLRDKVYTLMRDEAHILLLSPSKPKKPSSTFEASCGISQDTVTSHNSFPESGHMTFALQFINEGIANSASEKVANNNISGFGMSSFSDQVKYKDFDIFDSSLGRLVPSCDKSMSSLLGKKPVDGLRLTQPVWSKTENLLRSASQVLGTAEHFLAATGHLLNSEDSVVPAEVRSFLLQLDKALGSSQLLLMGSIANCTLSKRAEFLENISIAEPLKDSLLKSPLSDKMFGLPLQRVQEELSKNPPPVKVSVQVTNGKRSVNATSSSTSTSASGGPPSSAKKRKNNYGKPQNKPNNSGKSSDRFGHQLFSVPRLPYLLEKVRDNSVSRLCFPGRTFPNQCRPSPPTRGEIYKTMSENTFIPDGSISHSTSILATSGSIELSGRCNSIGTTSHSSASVLSAQVMDCSFTRMGSIDSNHSAFISTPSMVVSTGKCNEGPMSVPSSSQSNIIHRCLHPRLGSISGGAYNLGSLESRSFGRAYQCIGNESSSVCTESFPNVSKESVCHSGHGQHNSCSLSQESGRNSFTFSLSDSQRHSPSVFSTPGSSSGETYCGAPQYSSRHSIQIPCSSKHGVGTTSSSFQSCDSSLGVTSDRSVCDQSQSQTSNICVSGSRSKIFCGRRNEPILERNVRVRLPSFQVSLPSTSENSRGKLQDHSYCSSMAKTVLVSRPSAPIMCLSSSSTSETRPSVSNQGQGSLSKSRKTSSTRLASLRVSLRKRGFSEGATKHLTKSVRDSTSIVYDAKWSIFSDWCSEREIDPFQVTVQQLADFLVFLFESKGLCPSTIKGYRSAISRTIHISGGPDFGINEHISLLVRSFSLERPRQKTLVPKWDLGLVLSFLKLPPFEPAETIDLRFLSYKCCFLLALASGRRRSEIHAFSISDACLRFNRDKSSVTLLTDPAFLAKNQIPDKGAEPVVIPALPSDSISVLLCPVRILSIYLERTCSLRSVSNSRLFIPIKKGISDLSVKTISTWICKCISLAYGSSKAELLNSFNVKAHDVRGISTSWALFNSASLEEVLSAGFWRNENSFISHYLQSMATFAESLYSLGPIVSAQRLNFPPVSSVTGDSALR
ncbi:MTH [Mytilus edulis]|uniref:MTH n=1 Tax=Mytilus edulis TaxID=6550 RepID=A0A8S3PW88_MYTED|nr:MTH [Mytilus edulis]